MKAVLKYSLYRRPEPTNEGDTSAYLLKGTVIEVTQVVAGSCIDGIGLWFFADDGFYYWGGGADFTGRPVFADWAEQRLELQKAILESLVCDEMYWFEKKVEGLVGCGWGFKNDDPARGLSVSVFVRVKTPTPVLEKTIRYKGFDIPIDIKAVKGFAHHLSITNNPPLLHVNDQMGGSISVDGSGNYGTRSMALIKDGARYLMSCFHVLLPGFKSTGFPVQPPQRVVVEFPCRQNNPYQGSLNRGVAVLAGKYSPYYDFALVSLHREVTLRNAINDRDFTGFYLLSELKTLIGKTVTMVGATSFLQTGVVKDVRAKLLVDGRDFCYNIVVIEMISAGGDSGAPVIDEGGKLVGIVVAGNGDDLTLVLPVPFLFTQLGYTLL